MKDLLLTNSTDLRHHNNMIQKIYLISNRLILLEMLLLTWSLDSTFDTRALHHLTKHTITSEFTQGHTAKSTTNPNRLEILINGIQKQEHKPHYCWTTIWTIWACRGGEGSNNGRDGRVKERDGERNYRNVEKMRRMGRSTEQIQSENTQLSRTCLLDPTIGTYCSKDAV